MHDTRSVLFIAVIFTAAIFSGCASNSAGQGSTLDEAAEQRPSVERTEQIAAVHRDNRAAIRECFAEEATNGDIGAEVELQLPASGTPASIRLLEPDKLPESLRSCVERVLADFEYGQGRRGVTVYQTITFNVEEARLEFDEPVDAHRRWGLTGNEIDNVIHGQREAIDACYELAPEAPAGRVLVTLGIDSDGSLARTSVKSSTLENEQVEDCLVEVLVELQFKQPRGGGVVVIDYPFRFSPDEGWLMDPAPGL